MLKASGFKKAQDLCTEKDLLDKDSVLMVLITQLSEGATTGKLKHHFTSSE